MKKSFPKLAALSFVYILSSASWLSAAPIGHSAAGRQYLVTARPLDAWSLGVQARVGTREARVDNRTEDIRFTRLGMYAGYDIQRWITAFVKMGANDTRLDDFSGGQFSFEFGGGMRFNLFHHEILDPTLNEDRILINAAWEYSTAQAERMGGDQRYHELHGSLTMSIVNDVVGTKMYIPHAIALFFGPTYSLFDSARVSTRSDVGVLVGLEVYHSERTSFRFSVEQIGSDSTTGMFGVHVGL